MERSKGSTIDCIRYGKSYVSLDICELKRWVKRSSTKIKLKDIDR